MLEIRRATIADLERIVDFNARLAKETENSILDPSTVREGVRSLLLNQTHGSYYLAGANEAIGQLMYTREWSDWRNGCIWWIQSVYVHPDHRRRGVFRALYEHIETLAQADPRVVGLRLYVEHDNSAARATYRELGMSQAPYLVMQHLF
jgi:ribosomal protein S18 acetylase RimI-like enzyme